MESNDSHASIKIANFNNLANALSENSKLFRYSFAIVINQELTCEHKMHPSHKNLRCKFCLQVIQSSAK